jgi:AcrR family transcriptional regulator
MPRTVNPTALEVRREAFIDVAERLIQTKAYEQMTIQDVLDRAGASRGGFYHYFDSKQDLLQAVVARMSEAAMAAIEPIVTDPHLSAVAKLQQFFAGIAGWKDERRDLVLGIAEVWLSDDNALVREKFRERLVVDVTPWFAAIIRQGIAEGVLSAGSPDETARVLVSLIQAANQLATELFVARRAGTVTFDVVERAVTAYTEAYERILGAPSGSLAVDSRMLQRWFG